MSGQTPVAQDSSITEQVSVSQSSDIPPAPSKFKIERKHIIFISIVVVVLSLLTLVLVMVLKPGSNRVPNNKDQEKDSDNQSSLLQKQTAVAPKLDFSSYTLSDYAKNLPQPQVVSSYVLKTSFSEDDIKPIATKFGLTNTSSEQGMYLASSSTGETPDVMGFNKTTGSFQIILNGNSDSQNGGQGLTMQQAALERLQSIGVADPSVECQITYSLKNMPDITYVECHRNWQKLSLPLFDFAGFMNLSVNDLASKSKPGMVYQNTPDNPNVVNVSNGGEGKARPNDFNTAVVGIRQDGTIASIDSNLRWITNTVNIPIQSLISREQAINLAVNQKSELYFSMPSPSDKASWSEIYPGNTGKAESANVEELLLVYLEKPTQSSQSAYEPYYLIRGTALLESGHAVKYVQALKADKSKYSEKDLSSLQSGVAGDDLKQLQLKTFKPVFVEPTPVPSTPSVPGTNPDPNPYPQSPFCTIDGMTKYGKNSQGAQGANGADGVYGSAGQGESIIINIPGYGRVGVVHEFTVYYIVSLTDNKPVEKSLVMQELAKHDAGTGYGDKGIGCEISTNSPAVFIYPESTINVEVKLGPATAYTDPVANKNEWFVSADRGGDLIADKKRKYLYYEYDASKTKFIKPTEGFVIKKSEIKNLISKISYKVGLNNEEESVLLNDSIDILSKVDSEYVLVGFASREALDSELPISINPAPKNLHRINLTFSKTEKDEVIKNPKLTSIERNGYTVVEVGVSFAEIK